MEGSDERMNSTSKNLTRGLWKGSKYKAIENHKVSSVQLSWGFCYAASITEFQFAVNEAGGDAVDLLEGELDPVLRPPIITVFAGHQGEYRRRRSYMGQIGDEKGNDFEDSIVSDGET